MVNVVIYIWGVIFFVENTDDEIFIPFLIVGLDFLMLSVLFGSIGFKICRLIQTNFPDFYRDNKSNLIAATLGLSIPLLARGIVDTSRYLNDKFRE